MPRSVYFSHGTRSEHLLHEDIIVESISIYGQNFYYIPRELVAKDEILGEDRLSKFKKAFAIEMYLENAEGFEGQGAFIQRFGGMMMEQSATLTVARRRWEQLVGRFGVTTIPSRPNEGDLLYFPLLMVYLKLSLYDIKILSIKLVNFLSTNLKLNSFNMHLKEWKLELLKLINFKHLNHLVLML